jgi:hypothetical protein
MLFVCRHVFPHLQLLILLVPLPKYYDVTNIFYVCGLLSLAPVREIRIERQSLLNVLLVLALWFRPVPSLSFESFFGYLIRKKCCPP